MNCEFCGDPIGHHPACPAWNTMAAAFVATPSGQWGLVSVAWVLVAMPLGWGVLKTLTLAGQMFR